MTLPGEERRKKERRVNSVCTNDADQFLISPVLNALYSRSGKDRRCKVEIQKLKEALRPFALLGGPDTGFAAAYADLDDDVVVYNDSINAITAGDVRAARKLISEFVQPPPWAHRITEKS